MDVMRQTNPQLSQHSTAESEAFELKVPGTPLLASATIDGVCARSLDAA
jgi:hypothetical protein